jgi:excisionase family DNA binding protein
MRLMSDENGDLDWLKHFKVSEVAERWVVPEITVRRMIDRREMKVLRLGRSVRVPLSEVERVESIEAIPAAAPSEKSEGGLGEHEGHVVSASMGLVVCHSCKTAIGYSDYTGATPVRAPSGFSMGARDRARLASYVETAQDMSVEVDDQAKALGTQPALVSCLDALVSAVMVLQEQFDSKGIDVETHELKTIVNSSAPPVGKKPMDVKCPKCHQLPGDRCRDMKKKPKEGEVPAWRFTKEPHKVRVEAAGTYSVNGEIQKLDAGDEVSLSRPPSVLNPDRGVTEVEVDVRVKMSMSDYLDAQYLKRLPEGLKGAIDGSSFLGRELEVTDAHLTTATEKLLDEVRELDAGDKVHGTLPWEIECSSCPAKENEPCWNMSNNMTDHALEGFRFHPSRVRESGAMVTEECLLSDAARLGTEADAQELQGRLEVVRMEKEMLEQEVEDLKKEHNVETVVTTTQFDLINKLKGVRGELEGVKGFARGLYTSGQGLLSALAAAGLSTMPGDTMADVREAAEGLRVSLVVRLLRAFVCPWWCVLTALTMRASSLAMLGRASRPATSVQNVRMAPWASRGLNSGAVESVDR